MGYCGSKCEADEIIEYKGYEIGIFPDDDAETSREWDNLGHMVCWHSRYNLGDEQRRDEVEDFMKELACQVDETAEARIEYWENGNGWKMLENKYGTENYSKKACEMSEGYVQAIIEKALEKVVMLPLYLYDHSGITMKTSSFNDRWDSGQVGFIYITYEKIKEEFKTSRVTRAMHIKMQEYLKGEVETYDMYLTGNVHGYMIRKPEGDWQGGCWGFFGDYDGKFRANDLVSQAQGEVDWEIEQSQKAKQKVVA